ncbi:MAG: malonate transporter subunit MadM [Sphingomonadaceae bacterium]
MTGTGLMFVDHVLTANSLLVAFALVGIVMWLSNALSSRLTGGRIHGSAIAIIFGLALAFWGGITTGGHKGLSDIPVLSGIGLMGGAMLRDFAIVATACEVDIERAKRAGLVGIIALVLGTVLPFLFGAGLAWAFGYRDAVTISTIGAGAVTYIVGPVTGAALGAAPVIVTLSIGIGVVKAILVMITTPMVARFIGLDNPRSAMVFGGMMGTVSGVTAGLAATDRRLVPYGALTATFHTGLGCLLAPSILYLAVLAVTG